MTVLGQFRASVIATLAVQAWDGLQNFYGHCCLHISGGLRG